MYRFRAYASPVLPEESMIERRFVSHTYLRCYYGDVHSFRVSFAPFKSNSLPAPNFAIPLVIRVPCRVAMDGFGSKYNNPIASELTRTVICVIAGSCKSFGNRTSVIPTLSESIEDDARLFVPRLPVNFLALRSPFERVLAIETLPPLTILTSVFESDGFERGHLQTFCSQISGNRRFFCSDKGNV